MKTGLESLDTGAPKITYSGNEGPQAPQQMAMADPMLVEQYQQYVFEMEEQGLQPMSFEEFVAQARAGMNEGGIANPRLVPHTGADLLVKKNPDGTRPKYQPPGGGATSLGSGRDYSGSDRGPREDPDRFGPTTKSPDPRPVHHPGVDKTYVPTTIKPGYVRPEPKDKDDDGIIKNIINNRTKAAFNASLIIPGQTERIAKYRKAYKDYLISMGITPPSSLDDEDLSNFFVNDAFNYEPGASDAGMPEAMNYGDFLLERFNNPTVKYRGDLGAYKRDMGLGGDGPKPIIYPYPISTAVAPAVAPETEVATATGNPFLPGGNLPFANYGTAAHGAQFGVDQRMFAADGGRIGYANGADYYANLYSKYAQDMIKDGNTPMPIEDFVAIIKEQEKTSKAQGGRIGYAGGGIADLRQGYFLGKLVKKATRGIKKIIKSPIGKAALLAGGAGLFGYGPAKGLFASGKGLSFKNFLADKILGTMKYGYPTEAGVRTGGLLNFLKTPKGAFTGIAALSSLPLLFGQSQEEEEGVNYADLPNIFDKYSPDQLRQMALAGTLPQNEYPFQSYYAADRCRGTKFTIIL